MTRPRKRESGVARSAGHDRGQVALRNRREGLGEVEEHHPWWLELEASRRGSETFLDAPPAARRRRDADPSTLALEGPAGGARQRPRFVLAAEPTRRATPASGGPVAQRQGRGRTASAARKERIARSRRLSCSGLWVASCGRVVVTGLLGAGLRPARRRRLAGAAASRGGRAGARPHSSRRLRCAPRRPARANCQCSAAMARTRVELGVPRC